MCGITGFVGKGDLEDLKKMNSVLSYRGPDAEGYWYDRDRAVYIAHKRLSIIDISGGSQPMWTKDHSLGVIYNGEIYNHIEIRMELEKQGYVFQTDHSDTEVLLHGYRQWGDKLPDKLNGMWAFAIYDRDRNHLFISRDRFGQKPLFYSNQNGTFAFASELSALIKHRSIKSSISLKSIKKYFAYGYIPSPSSLYMKIYKLPAGHNLLLDIDTQSFHIHKYWDFVIEPFDSLPKNPEDEWGEKLLELIGEAVKKRMISDVPLGVFLSGGIDSSTITAFALKNIEHEKLKTFSIGFEEASFDESNYSNRAASIFKTEHHLDIFSIEKALTILPEIIDRLDEPMGDSSLLPTYLLCKNTRKYVTVAVGGDCADELFAGYDPFHALKPAEMYSVRVLKKIHPVIRMLVSKLPTSHKNMSFDFKVKRFLRGISYNKKIWNSVWLGVLEPVELQEIFEEPVDIEDIYSEAIEQWDFCTQDNIVDKTLQFFTKLYLQDDILVKIDRASMLNSLEVRSPFLDIDLVNFVRKIPHEYKFRNGQTKYILKKALKLVLPKDIIYRSKKGFGIPIGKWFKDGKLDLEEGLSINQEFTKRRILKHKNGEIDDRAFLWNQWVLGKYS